MQKVQRDMDQGRQVELAQLGNLVDMDPWAYFYAIRLHDSSANYVAAEVTDSIFKTPILNYIT